LFVRADEPEDCSSHSDRKRSENGSGNDVGEPVSSQVEASERDDNGDRHGEKHQKAFDGRRSVDAHNENRNAEKRCCAGHVTGRERVAGLEKYLDTGRRTFAADQCFDDCAGDCCTADGSDHDQAWNYRTRSPRDEHSARDPEQRGGYRAAEICDCDCDLVQGAAPMIDHPVGQRFVEARQPSVSIHLDRERHECEHESAGAERC